MLAELQAQAQKVASWGILLSIKQPQSLGNADDSGVAAVNKFNEYLLDAVSYAGYIVVALGIITLIIAFAEQNMSSKAKGSMLVAGGAIIISFAAVMENLKIGTDTTGKSITEKSLTMIGTGMTLVGAILLAYSVIQYIMAFIHSTPDESANSSKGLAVGVAFSAGGGIMKGLKTILTSNNSSTATIVKYVVYEVIAKAATYVGVGMLLYGVVTYLLAFRDESAEGKMKSSICFAVGLGLTSATVIINKVTGLGYYK